MTLAEDAVRESVERLRRWLTAQAVDGARPLSVELHEGEDSEGRRSWNFLITLPAPAPETSWAVEALLDLDRRTRDMALELGVPWPWHLQFRPDREPPPDPEDAEAALFM